MSNKNLFLRGGTTLVAAQFTSNLCSFGRNIIIARLVAPEDFGIASIFVMVVAFFEMISNLSLDRLLIQAQDGDEPEFQKVAHFILASRGMIIFAILLLAAGTIANMFDIPETKNAFYALAFIPLFSGFNHLDIKRFEKTMQFLPGATVVIASQFVTLVLAWPIGKFYGDYRAMLALLFLNALISLLLGHIVAFRTYRWSQRKCYLQRFITFGWPLLLNGLLMFCILQSDRFFIGTSKKLFNSSFDMADVGVYSAATMLTMVPAMILIKVGSSLFFPVLSKMKDDNENFLNIGALYGKILAFLGGSFCIFVILSSDTLIPTIYGNNYKCSEFLTIWLAIFWALRIMRVLPTAMSMARGNTINLLKTNILRLLSLGLVIIVVAKGIDLFWIAAAGVLGEIIAYSYSLKLNYKNLKIPYSIYFTPILILLTCTSIAIATKFKFVTILSGNLTLSLGMSMIISCILGYILWKWYGHELKLMNTG